MTATRKLLASIVAGTALLAGAAPALAQGQMPLRNSAAQRAAQGVVPERAPAALPGAAGSAGANRSTASAAGMKPNEALFDAVNRGDIGAAREALSRGADVDSRNVLGLTPVELSVDLGRNDITFLLLSMRSSGSGRMVAAAPSGRVAATPVRAAPSASTARATPVRATATAQAATPGRDPGVPAPRAGFLGFGGSQ